MKRVTLLIIALTLIFSHVQAQRSAINKAKLLYDNGEWFQAADRLKEVYNVVSDKTEKAEILFKIGECYRRLSEPEKAEIWYNKAINKEYANPVIYFNFGKVKKMLQKYEEAIEMFKKYKELVPSDARGEGEIDACQAAMKWINNPNGYLVENAKPLNSKDRDFCPAYSRDDYGELYFTSMREESAGNTTHGGTGESFSDIFSSKVDKKGSWSVPLPLSENINGLFDEGCPSFTADFQRMFFTRCEFAKKKSFGCQIYTTTRSGDDWAKPEVLQIAGDSIVVAQPAISPDELTLYFVSDMKGSVGGKDLWMVTRTAKDADWSDPVNLGPSINTFGDEMFPYVHPDGTLYFSSDGHPGMGGLDIFKARKGDDGTWKVENMRYPINSPSDDFGIVFEATVERGFLSSTRGQRGDDDLYLFYLPPLKFNLTGIVKDEKTDEPIGGVTIRSVSSDGIQLEAKTDKSGEFRYVLKPSTDYVYIASKEGYLNNKERETTKGKDKSQDFRVTILLNPINRVIEIPNIYYDFNSADLRPESMVALDRLVEILNDNPNVTIELGSHTDARGTDADNLDLSQRRAQSVVTYLISKGIAADRLVSKGYGETTPKVIDKKTSVQYPFLPEGTVLDEHFISQLTSTELQEIAHLLNRRTEFRVLSTDYKKK